MNKEPDSWITINGQHVPIFEGEGKREAVSRFLNKKTSRVSKNKDKYDTINQYKKRKATNKLDEDNFDWRGEKQNFKKLIKQGNNRYIVVRNDETEDEAIRKFNQRENSSNMERIEEERFNKKYNIDNFETKRRQGLIDFTQNNREKIKEWQKDYDDEAVSEKVLSGKGLTLKEYYGVLGRAPREGDIILAGGRNGEDVRVGKNGKLEIIDNYKKKKRSNH